MKFIKTGLFVFAFAFFVPTSQAQTDVCNGDSVVLVLNGYKQGSTLWQHSPDQTTWDTAAGKSYNDSLVLAATNTFYYRARVTDGTCSPFYSDTMLVIVNPSPPIAKPATGITQYGFTANWSAAAGATDYFLDVSTDSNFTSFVPGFKNHEWSDTTISIDGLFCDITYYYRVRDSSDVCPTISANSNTITVTTDSCPHPVCSGTITDSRDGKIYKIIGIGDQCWMAQNLNVGTAILGEVQQTQAIGIEKYCYGYDAASNMNDSSQCATYGGLYMWDEMMAYGPSVNGDPGPKGICPTGWHLPTDGEWSTLETFLGGPVIAGNKLKTKGSGVPPLWQSPSAGTDTSHFSALPGGYRSLDGTFTSYGTIVYFWTATESNPAEAWTRSLSYGSAQVYGGAQIKEIYGFGVRCVKN